MWCFRKSGGVKACPIRLSDGEGEQTINTKMTLVDIPDVKKCTLKRNKLY